MRQDSRQMNDTEKQTPSGSATHLPHFAGLERKKVESLPLFWEEEKNTGCLFWFKGFMTTPETPKNKM